MWFAWMLFITFSFTRERRVHFIKIIHVDNGSDVWNVGSWCFYYLLIKARDFHLRSWPLFRKLFYIHN